MIRHIAALIVLLIGLAACSTASPGPLEVEELPIIDQQTLQELLGSGEPAVVNVWASWCIPCRSEAPLLVTAHETFEDDVTFIGIDTEDTQNGARQFIAEFGIEFVNYFDRAGTVRSELGGLGVPITYFFASDGELVYRHNGVIDERTLSLQIDEILNR